MEQIINIYRVLSQHTKKWAIILPILILTACSEDYFNLENPNATTPESFWNNETDANMGLTAVYNALMYDGLYSRWAHVYNEGRSDEMVCNSPWFEIQNIMRFNLGTTSDPWSVLRPWQHCYMGLNRANQVLEHVPGIEMDDERKKHILGQAYFFRSYFLYYLYHLYNNIPIRDKVPADVEEYFIEQEMDDNVVWEVILSSMETAVENLPDYWVNENDKGRVSAKTALAFLGKFHLYRASYIQNNSPVYQINGDASDEFRKAKEYFEELILNEGKYNLGLMSNYGDNFSADNALKNNMESLFEIQQNALGGTDMANGGVNGVWQSNWPFYSFRTGLFGPPEIGWYDAYVNNWVKKEFELETVINATDTLVDQRMDESIAYSGMPGLFYNKPFDELITNSNDRNRVFVKKFQNYERTDGNERIPGAVIKNFTVLRYADVLLMYAECLNELDDLGGCSNVIDRVRERAGLPNLQNSAFATSLSSKEEMRVQIAHERITELSFEGTRFDDIVRWGWLNDPDKYRNVRRHDPSEFPREYREGMELAPIPRVEIELNNYIQNANYF